MAPPSMNVIYISSDEDDDRSKRPALLSFSKKKPSTSIASSSSRNDVSDDDDDDDDCVILDGDPDKPVRVSNDTGNKSDDLLLVAEKGQVACRDYPHARHMCARYPFITNPHERFCSLCHCYVCDTKAPCVYWGTGNSSGDHCHSTDKEETWRAQRIHFKQEKDDVLSGLRSLSLDQSRVQSARSTGTVKCFSCSFGFGYITPDDGGEILVVRRSSIKRECKSLVEGEKVEFRIESRDEGINEAIDVCASTTRVESARSTGTVKWFCNLKCYGFITPNSGGEDLFVHRSSIRSKRYLGLTQGETVEFQIESSDKGRDRAIDVTGPGGSLVQGRSN